MKEIIDCYYDQLMPSSFERCTNKTNGKVKSCEECFQAQYDYSEHSPSYDCEEKKKLYAVRFLFVHQSEVLHGLGEIESTTLDSWFNQGEFRVLSVGGGPGTDIFSAMKYIKKISFNQHKNIEFFALRLELDESWDSYFEDLYKKTFDDIKSRYAHTSVTVKAVDSAYRDVNSGDVIEDAGKRRIFDLACVSYLVSELLDITGLVNILDSALAEGSALLITDIDNEEAKERARQVFDLLGIEALEYPAPTYVIDGVVRQTWAGHIYGEYMPKLNSEDYSFQYSSRVFCSLDPAPKTNLKAVNFLGYRK